MSTEATVHEASSSSTLRYSGIGSHVSKAVIKHLPLIAQARIGTQPKIIPNQFIQMHQQHVKEWNQTMQAYKPADEKELIGQQQQDEEEEEMKMVSDVQVQTPHQIISSEIDRISTEILLKAEQNPKYSATEFAFQAEIPKFDNLCAEFESLRDQFRNAMLPKRNSQHTTKLLNAISEDVVNNRIREITNTKGVITVTGPEVVLRVGIYDCRTRTQSQEFLMLGSQTLAELKDAIVCLTDKVYGSRYSRSGYFFIEDVFYDDMRHAPSEEGKEAEESVQPFRYSDVIVEWVKQKKRFTHPGLNRFSQSEMEKCVVGNLSIRLNSLYYFVHHGQCTHSVVFKEIRMMDPQSDCTNRNVYPLLIYLPRNKVRKCGVCDIYAAKHVTYGDRLAPESPFFFCHTCYHQLHYDAEGNLLYPDFHVFPYYHD